MTRSITARPSREATTTQYVAFKDDAPESEEVLCRLTDPVAAVAVSSATQVPGSFALVLGREPLDAPIAVVDNVSVRLSTDRVEINAASDIARRAASVVVAEFYFYELHLRLLESALPAIEATAANDVPFAFRPKDKDRAQWDRLGKTLESLAHLRLKFARLEPRLVGSAYSRTQVDQKLFRRLATRLDVETRLESVNDRLEACEDLYEGAVDRITDHRWYRRGNGLEITIVILLLIEVAQISLELWLRWRSLK